MMVWRFSRDLYDRRGRGQDRLLGRTSEDSGAAPGVLAHPGASDSAVWEPQAGSLETGLPASHPGRVSHQAASRIAEICSALCGASRAYGRFDAWWKHEPECPVRASRIVETPYPEGPLASRKAP